MKAFATRCALIAAALLWAGNSAASVAADATAVSGEVIETQEVENYTYLKLRTKDGETWAVVSKALLQPGAKVTIENVMVMHDFESKTLKRSFPTILFGSLGGASGASASGDDNPHARLADVTKDASIRVQKASGANAWTVAEIIAKAGELKEKPVQVRGLVVKYNADIMGKNWIHLRDGSESAADGVADLLVTTTHSAKLGEVILVNGIVRTDKDFGSGYTYKVLIEEATLQR